MQGRVLLVVLFAVGLVIGLKVRRWRDVFIACACASGVWAVLVTGVLVLQGSDRQYGFTPALFTTPAMFLLLSAIASATFALRGGGRRSGAAD